MAGAIAIYSPGAMDSGGGGICNTPPTSILPAPANPKYLINGVPPVLEGDTMTPAAGVIMSPSNTGGKPPIKYFIELGGNGPRGVGGVLQTPAPPLSVAPGL